MRSWAIVSTLGLRTSSAVPCVCVVLGSPSGLVMILASDLYSLVPSKFLHLKSSGIKGQIFTIHVWLPLFLFAACTVCVGAGSTDLLSFLPSPGSLSGKTWLWNTYFTKVMDGLRLLIPWKGRTLLSASLPLLFCDPV